MNFIKDSYQGKNGIGRWIIMLIVLLLATQIVGAIPFGIVIGYKIARGQAITPNPENSMDLSGYGLSENTALLLMIIPFAVGLLSIFMLMKPIHARSIRSVLTGAKKFRWARFLWAAGVWFALLAGITAITIQLGLQDVELQFNPSAFFSLILISLLFIPLQAGFEEVIFRGYLMQGFAQMAKNRWVALLITALLFGGLHYFNPEVKAHGAAITMPQYIWFGLFFGICTLMDDGLEIAWGAHAMNNAGASIFLTQESSVLQTDALFNITRYDPAVDLAVLFIASLIFLAFAARKYNWTDWSLLYKKEKNPFYNCCDDKFSLIEK